jgi:plastocyanin
MNGRFVWLALVVLGAWFPPEGAAQGTGSVTGVAITAVPAPRPVRVSFDQKVCGAELPDASIQVNGAGRLANAVVTLTGVKAKAPARVAPVINEKCAFVPRVQVVAPAGTVKTSSKDAVLHTTVVQTADGRQLFNVALPVPGLELTKTLPAAGVLRVGCSTHQWMRGWIIATDELSAVTAADGTFTLPDVPPGTYQLRVWHEALKGATQTVTVAAGKATTVTFDLK